MLNDGHQVSRNAKWAIAQTISSAGVLFVLYRFLLNELGAEKLGLWSLILASTSLARLGELGFSTATLRFVAKYTGLGKLHEAAEILETALLTISLPFLLLTALAVPLVGSVLQWFVPTQHIAEALVVLPWAMLALWLGVTGGIVQSAIDGYGRMDQRNMVLIVTNLIYLALAVLLTPAYGLTGVAFAQAVQGGASLVLMWLLAKAQLRSLPWLPWRWHKHRFSEVAGFALTMQIGSIAGMFIEPITKAMVSRFGGLEFLAYYEMANQVMTRARSVLVSGFQAITPQFSMTKAPPKHRELFLESQRKAIDIGIPFMSFVMLAIPTISQIWIGRYESAFITSGLLIGLTWLLVTLMMPAYFYLTGSGRGFPIAVAHVLSLVGTIFLGWMGGRLIGQYGPIIGAAISLLLGNVCIYFIAVNGLFKNDHDTAFPNGIGIRMMKSSCWCLLVVGLNLLATEYVTSLLGNILTLMLLTLILFILAFGSRIKQNRE